MSIEPTDDYIRALEKSIASKNEELKEMAKDGIKQQKCQLLRDQIFLKMRTLAKYKKDLKLRRRRGL
jgi:hypothetical protein